MTSGATEAITACLMAVLNPGDEVVLIEPLYDTYLPVVRLLGATPRLVRLEPPDWTLPLAALADAFGPKTKAILLNSPMNPAGKVFTADELGFIADLRAAPRRLRDLRRGLRAPDLRRAAAHPADDAARHARAHHADWQRRQDVRADRLEGGLRHRAGVARRERGEGAPEPDLHHRAQPAARGRGRPGQGRRLLRRSGQCACRPSAIGWRPGWRAWA